MRLLTAIASAFAVPWQPIHSPPPIMQGRGFTKPHQRRAKRKRAQRRAKRLKHY